MALSPELPASPAGLRVLGRRIRTAAWLGWQIESNWADALTFFVYTLIRPVGTSLILAGIYWAAAHQANRAGMFAAFYVGNAFHEYVARVLVGMGWAVVEEREEYETLKLVYASPMGLITYLTGRAAVKFALATFSVVLVFALGWIALGLRWDWAAIRWLPLALSFAMGLLATLFLGYLLAGWALVLPRIAMSMNEGMNLALYLLCGVIFPIDLLPRAFQWVSLLLPFTYWYAALRRFLLGYGASHRLDAWSDGRLLGMLALTTLAFGAVARWGYGALERKARRDGRLDQTTLF